RARPRAWAARHPRQRDCARLDRDRPQPRISGERTRRRDPQRHPARAFRRGARPRWRAVAARLGRGPLHDRHHRGGRRRPDRWAARLTRAPSVSRVQCRPIMLGAPAPSPRDPTMDFTLPPQIEDIRLRTRDFVAQHVLPLESDRDNYDRYENIRADLLADVRAKAKDAGLWAPQAPVEFGGMGLAMVGWAAMYEEANRSIFGRVCFNCAAPDDGNMNLLALVGTPAQKEKWLRPIVTGEARSSFAMTEPAPGGGSDPSMIRTRAERRSGHWVIHGHKWFITGAGVADHFIL